VSAHDHHHDGPLESITHVHGGAMVLDIGGTVGALHVLVDDAWVGRELFLATDDPAFSVHTGVWLRHRATSFARSKTCSAHVAGEHIASALFAALEHGSYRVLGTDGDALTTARVVGGEVTEVDLTA
jgi:hypothetical protein